MCIGCGLLHSRRSSVFLPNSLEVCPTARTPASFFAVLTAKEYLNNSGGHVPFRTAKSDEGVRAVGQTSIEGAQAAREAYY